MMNREEQKLVEDYIINCIFPELGDHATADAADDKARFVIMVINYPSNKLSEAIFNNPQEFRGMVASHFSQPVSNKKGVLKMNNIVKAEDLTAEQKESVILPYNKTWGDVVSINYQMRKDGSVSNYSIDYKYVEQTIPDMTDAMTMLFGKKHSRVYQSAKKRLGVSNNDINSARRIYGVRK